MRGFASLLSWRFYLGAIAASLLCPLSAQAIPEIILTPTGTGGSAFYLQPNTANQVISIYVSTAGTVATPSSGIAGTIGNSTNTLSGMDFYVTIQDGATGFGKSGNPSNLGPNNTGTGPGANPALGPMITSADIFPANSLFNPSGTDGNTSGTSGNSPTAGTGLDNQTYSNSTTLSSGTITITGTAANPQLLATVTLSTVGVAGTALSPVLYSISVKGTYENGGGVDTAATDFVGIDPQTWFSQPNPNYVDGVLVVPEPASLGLLALAVPALLLRRRTSLV